MLMLSPITLMMPDDASYFDAIVAATSAADFRHCYVIATDAHITDAEAADAMLMFYTRRHYYLLPCCCFSPLRRRYFCHGNSVTSNGNTS